jgi:hypothetical protein
MSLVNPAFQEKIGNIISEKPLPSHTKLANFNYYVGKDGYSAGANGKPSLFVGWKYFKTCFPDWEKMGYSVLEKDVKRLLHWEFDFNEDMPNYFDGLENFIRKAPDYLISGFRYSVIDPIFNKIESEKEILIKINSAKVAYIYKNEMIYLWDKNRQLTGIYLVAYKYFGFNIQSIISMITENCETYHDVDGAKYVEYHKKYPEFGHLKRSMVVFIFS